MAIERAGPGTRPFSCALGPIQLAAMDTIDPESVKMLKEARKRAAKLIAEMRKQQAEVEKSPPKIAPEKLAQGRFAMTNAIAAAERMLKNVDEALGIAAAETN